MASKTLIEKVESLRAALREIYEVWAGSEAVILETATEKYQQFLIEEMRDIAALALANNPSRKERSMQVQINESGCIGLTLRLTINQLFDLRDQVAASTNGMTSDVRLLSSVMHEIDDFLSNETGENDANFK